MLTIRNACPDDRLRPFIRSYVQRESQWNAPASVEPVVARLGAVLEFQFADPYEVPLYGTDISLRSNPITVIGPITFRRAQILIRGHVEALTVFFQPLGFHALFGVPVASLTDEGADGHGVLGPAVSSLFQRLGGAASFEERKRLLDDFFLHRLAPMRTVNAVSHELSMLVTSRNPVTVSRAARQAGVSTRQMERLSLQYAGMSPQLISRIGRFQRALRLKVGGSSFWTDIAHRANYHDQMHMIRDFRAFTGENPVYAFSQMKPDHLSRLGL